MVVKLSNNRKFLITTIILIVILLLSLKSCNDKKQKIELLNNQISLLDETYKKKEKVWEDKLGNQHITQTQLQVTQPFFNQKVKSTAKLLKVKPKNISSFTTSSLEVHIKKGLEVNQRDTIIVRDSIHDTLRQFSFSYEDKWAMIRGCIGDSIDCKDSISINLTDSLTITVFKKKHLFKGDEMKIDIMNQNPYLSLKNLTSISVPVKQKKLGVGLTLGIGYSTQNIISKSPYPSLQVSISMMYLPLSIKF